MYSTISSSPDDVTTISKDATESLRCTLGDHDWQRDRKRGVKPKNCPDHAPKKAAAKTAVTKVTVTSAPVIDLDSRRIMADAAGAKHDEASDDTSLCFMLLDEMTPSEDGYAQALLDWQEAEKRSHNTFRTLYNVLSNKKAA